MKVLVVDDDKVARKAVEKSLDDSFELVMAENGTVALEKVTQDKPDVIILDVEMPDMSGFEVCVKIKELGSDYQNIPIIFLSSLSTLSERLHGLEVGANDYLTKPFEPEILTAKLLKLYQIHTEKGQLKQQLEDANKAAFQALSGTSEFGTAIRFVEKSHSIAHYEHLAKQFFKATDQFGLNCSLMFNSDDESLFYTNSQTNPVVSPLEQELITMLSTAERFNDFGARTQINYPFVSLLVKNMPVEDRERYGRYKDLLPFMIEVANATVRSLNIEAQLIEQSHNLGKSFDVVKQTLTQLTEELQKNQVDVAEIMNQMLMELDEVVPGLGLDDDQESYLIGRVDYSVQEANSILEKGSNLKGSITNVIRLMDHLVEQQNNMVDKAMSSKSGSEDQDEEVLPEESCSDDDVELF